MFGNLTAKTGDHEAMPRDTAGNEAMSSLNAKKDTTTTDVAKESYPSATNAEAMVGVLRPCPRKTKGCDWRRQDYNGITTETEVQQIANMHFTICPTNLLEIQKRKKPKEEKKLRRRQEHEETEGAREAARGRPYQRAETNSTPPGLVPVALETAPLTTKAEQSFNNHNEQDRRLARHGKCWDLYGIHVRWGGAFTYLICDLFQS